jgi:phenylalanyl-tRNA synthetase beta chain
MKISYNWLKEFVDFSESPCELAKMLTFIGVETTVLDTGAPKWEKVVTAKVTDVIRHPNADKLSVCTVNDGADVYTVVCGATNVAAGQSVAFALIGAELPLPDGSGVFKIKKAKIRGVESSGMICSEEELGLAKESNGIMVLPETTVSGRPLYEVLGDNDTILEVEITTNRPDCLSHWGVAREIAARLRKPVKLAAVQEKKFNAMAKIAVDVPELCPRYTGTLIEGIKVGPSPEWMARRLEKCGLRPINNIVDITNYVLLELGHPLHAFDTDQMKGREIVVRKATAEEKILALDGKTYDLTPDMLVVADAERAQAIAGVMGGEISGVTETTKNVILESALFSASSVRRTSKKLNISTDASYRFERGTSWEVAEIASWRALDLILQLAGGTAVARTDLKKSTCVPVTIGLRPERINRVLGIEIPAAEAKEILLSLGMQVVENAGAFRVTVPSWRLDIKQEVDLIEEVIRIKGYENVPVTVMPVLPDLHEGKQAEPVEKEIRLRLRDLGFCEAVNQSFSEVRELERFNMQAVHRIKNPISKENEVLRPSLLPGLWKNLMDNLSQGMDAVRLFESGTAFTAAGEKKRFGMIVTGPVWAANWWKWEGKKIDDTFDFYFLNGIVNVLFAAGQIRITRSDSPASYFHPGKAALIEIDGTVAGEIGMLRPEYTADRPHEIGYAELYLDVLEAHKLQEPVYSPLRRHPPVKRDLSIVVKKDIPFEKIEALFNDYLKKGSLLQEYRLFSRYDDETRLGAGNMSYAIHLTFRHSERTLTDSDIAAFVDKIVQRLKREFNASLR